MRYGSHTAPCDGRIRDSVNLYLCERPCGHDGRHHHARNGIRASWSDGDDAPALRNAPLAGQPIDSIPPE